MGVVGGDIYVGGIVGVKSDFKLKTETEKNE